MADVAIVMYHYVRDLARSRYPELKARDLAEFRTQLDYIGERYTVVSAEQIAAATRGAGALPGRACFLTFDDGYLDHYLHVFPELLKRGFTGAFYPAVAAVRRERVMEVNKIQLVLARNGYERLERLLAEFRACYDGLARERPDLLLPDFDALREQTLAASKARFDPPEARFFKAALQHALPPEARTRLIDDMFARVMDADEATLAGEMYMSLDMLRVMAGQGMHIGSHGDKHLWLDKLTPDEQRAEVDASLAMLAELHGTHDFMWSMCYPFGGVNASIANICAERGCAFAVTVEAKVAPVDPQNRMFLPRLDTNDL